MNWKKLAEGTVFKNGVRYAMKYRNSIDCMLRTAEEMRKVLRDNLTDTDENIEQYAEVTPENDPPVNVDWKFPDKDGMPIDNEDIERFAYWCNTTGTCWVYPTSLYGLRKHHYEGRLIAYAKIETPPPPVMPRAWKECPWCKSDNIVRMEDDEQHYGLCTKCWQRGPSGKTPKEAMDRWGYKK